MALRPARRGGVLGRIVDVGDHHVDRPAAGQRGQNRSDQGSQQRRLHPPPGPDLHPHPAAADHDALNRAAGQVRGDLSVLAAVQAGHARAVPDGRGHGIDIHPVDDRGI